MYQEVTDRNLDSFHFHGDVGGYPVSAAIVVPGDVKSEALLAGRYLKEDLPVQLIRPREEFEALMGTLFQVQNLALVVLAVTLGAALAITVLVFALSFRLRRREFDTLADLGVAPADLVRTKVFEIAIVGGGGLVAALVLTVLVRWQAQDWIRLVLS
jgi:putative ABC transport system permease protein